VTIAFQRRQKGDFNKGEQHQEYPVKPGISFIIVWLSYIQATLKCPTEEQLQHNIAKNIT